MKRLLLILLMPLMVVGMMAQGKPKPFDPDRFQCELEQYMIRRAGITPQEASKFFPLFREMQKKQRVLFTESRMLRQIDMNDNDACLEAVRRMDEIDLQIRLIQQQYHQKCLSVLPATKLMKILRAEDEFHRKAFERVAGRKHKH